ncbi:MAG: dTDP-4-dehydrorhamnose 3,5-epimerase [Spirochaetota bacterium]
MPFSFRRLPIDGLVIIESCFFSDGRGFFMETYKKSAFADNGIDVDFVQDNHSMSVRGVVRGLHLQRPPYAQGKLVRVLQGSVWDVAVDLRPGSPTYARWYGIELSEENRLMFYIPPGFAHGFVALSDTAQFTYKCTAEYNRVSETGIRWDDPDINISWPFEKSEAVISDRDAALPFLKDWT